MLRPISLYLCSILSIVNVRYMICSHKLVTGFFYIVQHCVDYCKMARDLACNICFTIVDTVLNNIENTQVLAI